MILNYFCPATPTTALRHYEMALRLSPRDPLRFVTLMLKGSALRVLGRLDEAVAAGRECCGFQGAGYLSYSHLAASLAMAGRQGEARAMLDTARRLEPGLCLASIRSARAGMHPDMLAETLHALTAAGLPETAEAPIGAASSDP